MNLNYLAGFTDGEGCFCVCGRGPRIDWGQNDPEVLKEIRIFIESLGIHTNWSVVKANPKKRRPNPITHLWIARKRDCKMLCELLLPYLITKKADCAKLLGWIKDRPYLKNLNHIPSEQIITLWEQGYTGTYIAKELKISRSKLSTLSKKIGIVFQSGGKIKNGKHAKGLSRDELRERKRNKEKSKKCLDCPKLIWKYSGVRCNSCATKYRHQIKPGSFKVSNIKSVRGATDQ